MQPIALSTAQLSEKMDLLRAGVQVLLSGTVYTARDAAHKRLMALLEQNRELPFPIRDAVIYYAGPTGTPPGKVIGSCGPTTSGRMDPFTPTLLDLGLRGMIGKGERSKAVVRSMEQNRAVYFSAVGGAGALAASCITTLEEIAFGELGCESVKRLTFADFPLIVAIDCYGGNLFESGRAQYRKAL